MRLPWLGIYLPLRMGLWGCMPLVLGPLGSSSRRAGSQFHMLLQGAEFLLQALTLKQVLVWTANGLSEVC